MRPLFYIHIRVAQVFPSWRLKLAGAEASSEMLPAAR
jgi:hypothetical protein